MKNCLICMTCILVSLVDKTFAVPSITVNSCSRLDTAFNVLNGVPGGRVFIETIDVTSDNCFHPITNNSTEAFTTDFGACGVVYDELDSGRQIEFVVVIQDLAAYNYFTDHRYKVVCTFVIGQATANDVVVTSSNDPEGTAVGQVDHTVTPRPQLTLYQVDSVGGTTVSSNQMVEMGTNMMLKVDLVQNIPDVEFVVLYCYVDAIVSGSKITSLDIINQTTYCPIYGGLLSDFSYSYSSTDRFPSAHSYFKAFLPTVPSLKLRSTAVNTRFVCRVDLCLTSLGGCSYPVCSATRRRRSDDGEEVDNSTQTFTLTDNVSVYLGKFDTTNNPEDPNSVNPTERGDNSVCLDKSEFWVMLLSLLAVLLLAIVAVCVIFCLKWKKHRRHEKDVIVVEKANSDTTKSNSTLATFTSLTGESSSKGQLRFLPRFVSLNSLGTGYRGSASSPHGSTP